MITIYGIKQCDTCRKALKWAADQGLEHQFHDLRVDGLDAAQLRDWLASPFAERLVNQRSTTWRQLSEAEKSRSGDDLAALLLEHPALIKRPVFVAGGSVAAVGFDAASQKGILSAGF